MIKFKHGSIANLDGARKDIIVEAPVPNKVKDILIGVGLVAIGIGYLTTRAFKYGVEKFEEAEYKTMVSLGIIKE